MPSQNTANIRPAWENPLVIFLISTLGIIAYQPQMLVQPPYWDSLIGSYHEAIWLLKNNFNYKELAFAPGYISGGPRIYLYSIYPTLIALLLKLFGNTPITFVFHHLISIMSGAGCVAILYTLLRRKVSRFWSFAGSATLLLQPLFLSQSYAIGMDMPVTFFSFWAIERFITGRIKCAALLILIATLIKPNAAVPALACGLFGLILWKSILGKKKWLPLFFIPPVALLLQSRVEALLFDRVDLVPLDLFVNPWMLIVPSTLLKSHYLHLNIYPDGWLLALSIPTAGALFAMWHNPNSLKLKYRLFDNFQHDSAFGLNLCVVGGLTLITICGTTWIPRYILIVLPSMLYLLIRLLSHFPNIGRVVLILFVGMNVYNHEGQLYKDLQSNRASGYEGGHMNERSLLWIKDQQLYQPLITKLQADFADHTIVAPSPLSIMLHEPLLGYVEEPFKVVSFGHRSMMWNALPNFRSADDETLYGASSLWIDTRTVFTLHTSWMQDKDHTLASIPETSPRFILFKKNAPPPEATPRIHEER